jgi:phosphoribosylaminoimidazole-succinocarboxamide synthase
MENLLIYQGKVRNVYSMGDEYLLLQTSDRVSSFDRHICTIKGKGELLNKMSKFWFDNTRHIIPNHLLSIQNEFALVKRCEPIMIEFVVRGYITGSTCTSIWTHYKNGVRSYCGIQLPEGLKKNQKLDTPIITPTTKGKVDKPISKNEIINDKYLTEDKCEFIYEKAMELFKFGQKTAEKAGFILVDTKYEFGIDRQGNIILIDEVHTCDSSRYWKKKSYQTRFDVGLEPEKLDKDCIRDWVKARCDPYNDEIPEVDNEIIQKVYDSYSYFYNSINSINEV